MIKVLIRNSEGFEFKTELPFYPNAGDTIKYYHKEDNEFYEGDIEEIRVELNEFNNFKYLRLFLD